MKDRIQRVEYIRLRNESAKRDSDNPTYAIKNWRGRNILYPKIIQIDVDYLMYRIENSRTEIQQMKYLRDNPTLQRNLFLDPESSQAQEAQEEILNKINKAVGKAFIEDLRARGQEDPAIITYDGYLVNGNRRTAALKSLNERYINCVVLPEDANQRDIYELEQELQISQDFREPYHWINELKNIRKGMDDKRFNFSENEMAKRLRIDIKELRAKRRMLELIDSFLIWKGIEGQYDYFKLEDTEQIFIQLEKAIKKYTDSNKLDELKNAVFILIEQRPSKGRLYGYVLDLIKNFDSVYVKLLSDNQTHQITETPPINEEFESNNVLDDILEGVEPTGVSLFKKASKAPELAAILVEKIADVKAENKERNDTEAIYEAVSLALRELQGLNIENETAKKEEIKNKLIQIVKTSEELLQQLDSFEN